MLTITGNYTQTTNGALNIELAGLTAGSAYDRLAVSGTASLAGALNLALTNGFYPPANASFTFLTAATRSGTFATFNYPSNDVGMALNYSTTNASAQVINVRPVLPGLANQVQDELVLFSLNAAGTDGDAPAQTLTYALTNAPPGATIDAGTGVISWTPSEAQGPMTTNLTVLVTDNGTPNLTVARTFQITVNEINSPPVLSLPPSQPINEETVFSATATATDSDLPTNALSFSLVSPPAGATISSGGAFWWRPTVGQAGTTNQVRVLVQDDGMPALRGSNTFLVVVEPLSPVRLRPLGFEGAGFSLEVAGTTGPDYVVMASTNLTDWVDILTNQSPSVPFRFSDGAAGSFLNRSYRVRLSP